VIPIAITIAPTNKGKTLLINASALGWFYLIKVLALFKSFPLSLEKVMLLVRKIHRVGLFLILLLLLLSTPTWAATPPERTILTFELLQERIKSPLPSEGVYMIDLRQLVIDLTNDNADFRDLFYQQLQTQINRSKIPLGIDLSESLVQGEFTASRLGLRSPLYAPALSPLLTPAEQEQLQRDDRFLTELTEQDSPVTIFRGPSNLYIPASQVPLILLILSFSIG
jgi:hypothetical protein